MAFGDYQLEIYLQGLSGVLPHTAHVIRRAGGQGTSRDVAVDLVLRRRRRRRRTHPAGQRRRPSSSWGLMPRMFVGASERDLSVELFGLTLPSPAMMAPVGVIGAVRAGRARRPGDRAGRGAHRRADDRVDDVGRSDGGRGRRIGRHPRLFPALHPDRPRAGGQLRPSRRGGGIQGHRRDPGHLDSGLAAPRPDDVELPVPARALPGQLHQRSGVPREPGADAGGEPAGRRSCSGFRSSEIRSPGTTCRGCGR